MLTKDEIAGYHAFGYLVLRGCLTPEETAEVLTQEGWFHTGDIGEFDADGFLRITDRKKDLAKTSGGKYIAPQPIENQLKLHPAVLNAVVVADQRNFPTRCHVRRAHANRCRRASPFNT